MAAGEIYYKSGSVRRLFFRNPSDVEFVLLGARITSASAAAGEIYVRSLSGIPHFICSNNGSETFAIPTTLISSTTEPQGSIWVSSGNLNVSFNGSRWIAPVPDEPEETTTTSTTSRPVTTWPPGGCFSGDSLILTPDRGYIPISTINVGDKVISYNKLENNIFESEVKYVFIHDGVKDFYHPFSLYPLLKITYEINGIEDIIYITSNHSVLNAKTLMFSQIRNFKNGEYLGSPYGEAKIKNIETTDRDEVVYTLDVTDQEFTDNYVVQGIVAANK